MLARAAHILTNWSTRWVPDAFVIAILLTFVSGLLVWIVTPAGPIEIIQYWGDGFWTLLSFGMQICFIIITGYIVGVSPLVKRLLGRIVNLAKTPRQSVVITALVSMLLCSINWGMGLIASAILVRYMASSATLRGIRVDYRLLVACAYLGMATTWHAGLSASAPLLVATPGHFLEGDIGIIATTATIFHPFNLILLSVVIVCMTFLAGRLHPSEDQVKPIPLNLHDQEFRRDEGCKQEDIEAKTPAQKLEHSRILLWILAGMGVLWLLDYFYTHGFSLNLNVVNFLFLIIGIILHRHPRDFMRAAEQGGRFVWHVIIQFPLYAGIFGMIKYSGLQQIAGEFIVSMASVHNFALLNCWYSGLLNYMVPSGGGQWAIQAPYIMSAGQSLGVPPELTVLSFAWGEMLTDAIQPFFAVPLLGIAGIEFKDIMGYLVIFLLFYVAIVSFAFLLVGKQLAAILSRASGNHSGDSTPLERSTMLTGGLVNWMLSLSSVSSFQNISLSLTDH